MSGPCKSLYHQLLLAKTCFPQRIDNTSSCWHIKYQKEKTRIRQYEDLIFDTIKRPATYEKFGLNYFDLMRLPIPVFDRIRELILQIDKAVAKNAEQIKNSTEQFLHQQHKQHKGK